MNQLNFSDWEMSLDIFHPYESPIPIERKWNEKDKKFFQTLAENKSFEQIVLQTRQKAGIEKKLLSEFDYEFESGMFGWISAKNYLVSTKIDSLSVLDKKFIESVVEAERIISPIKTGVQTIFENFPLYQMWHKTLEKFVATGICVAPEELLEIDLYPKGSSLTFQGKTVHETQPEAIAILIQEPITKTSFEKIIDERWPQIEGLFRQLPKQQALLPLTERDFFILDLKDNKHFRFREIADEVEKKYGSDSEARINPESMKTAYHTAKKRLDSSIAATNYHRKQKLDPIVLSYQTFAKAFKPKGK